MVLAAEPEEPGLRCFAIGIVAGAFLDLLTNTRFSSRNLFPIEILEWLVVLMPLALLGTFLGWAISTE
jgi:hypothetical protein